MADIIDIDSRRPVPHLQGEAICAGCYHTWQAVAPVGTIKLECPQCRTMKGLFRNPVDPTGEKIATCGCGGQIFFMLSDRRHGEFIQCYLCGAQSATWTER